MRLNTVSINVAIKTTTNGREKEAVEPKSKRSTELDNFSDYLKDAPILR